MPPPPKPDPTSTRNDPLPVFCFKVNIDLKGGGGVGFFRSVSGIKYETEVIPVKEGGANDTTFNLVGATKWSNLILKQGFTVSSQLLAWREDWMSMDPARMIRKSGTIIQLNTAMQDVATWQFYNGWPCKWDLGDLDASKSELSIETLEIAIDGIKYLSGPPKPAAAPAGGK